MSEPREPSEPFLNAPWPVLILCGLIVGGYALQTTQPAEPLFLRYGFSTAALSQGRWETLVSALFLHGSWIHAVMNAAFALAFGAPLSRFFGTSLGGALIFLGFYLACGALSSLGYAALANDAGALLVGASGAVSGLMGATSRLMAGRGRLGPIRSPIVLSMAGSWLVVNLILAVLGHAPGLGDTPVAWQAHLVGFLAGLFLVGPVARLTGRPQAGPMPAP